MAALLCIHLGAAAQEEQAAATAPAPAAATAPAQKNPRRAETYDDAISAAGDDGIIVFCYGPDWNQRSARMAKNFWPKKEVENATGGAILVAVPFYQDPTPEQSDEAARIGGGVPEPPFGVCPSILMLDQNGYMYAALCGMDALGNEDGSAALKNMRDKLASFRQQKQLMTQAANLQGVEKAKILNQIAELPIAPPADMPGGAYNNPWSQHQRCSPGLLELIKKCDPQDTSGMVRRNQFDSTVDHLYKLMGTKDGFIAPDFVPDYKTIETECMKLIKDDAYRAEDRQAALCLLIGATRRAEGGGKKLKELINACIKLNPDSLYGRMCQHLLNSWGNLPAVKLNKDQRKQERAKEKDRRDQDRHDKKAARDMDIH